MMLLKIATDETKKRNLGVENSLFGL
jgi:hypothetical protein